MSRHRRPDQKLFAFARSIALCFHKGRSPDLQVNASPATFPFRRTVVHYAGRSLLTVAGPCGTFTRFPFHPSRDGNLREI
jgi:hypothetical protein